jgi:hypothetical protein
VPMSLPALLALVESLRVLREQGTPGEWHGLNPRGVLSREDQALIVAAVNAIPELVRLTAGLGAVDDLVIAALAVAKYAERSRNQIDIPWAPLGALVGAARRLSPAKAPARVDTATESAIREGYAIAREHAKASWDETDAGDPVACIDWRAAERALERRLSQEAIERHVKPQSTDPIDARPSEVVHERRRTLVEGSKERREAFLTELSAGAEPLPTGLLAACEAVEQGEVPRGCCGRPSYPAPAAGEGPR